MKNIHLFLDVFVLVVLCSIIFTGPARICDVTMSHTCIGFQGCEIRLPSNVTEIKAVIFLTFSFIFARFGRFACFGRFDGFVSVVSIVSVVSFRPFRFVVTGVSTCQFGLGPCSKSRPYIAGEAGGAVAPARKTNFFFLT